MERGTVQRAELLGDQFQPHAVGVVKFHLRGEAGTSMYDAILLAARDIESRQGRKILVVVTDGGDTTSSMDLKKALAKSKDWEKDIDWADTIIFDGTLGQGEKAQDLREQGKKVIGGTPHSDELEDDRSFGQDNDAQATRVRSEIPVGVLVAATGEAAYRSIFRKQRCAYVRDTVIEFCPEVP